MAEYVKLAELMYELAAGLDNETPLLFFLPERSAGSRPLASVLVILAVNHHPRRLSENRLPYCGGNKWV
ncbi:MAG: hypothetical protein ACPG5T_04785, partial [Endozoicomonas sp.]